LQTTFCSALHTAACVWLPHGLPGPAGGRQCQRGSVAFGFAAALRSILAPLPNHRSLPTCDRPLSSRAHVRAARWSDTFSPLSNPQRLAASVACGALERKARGLHARKHVTQMQHKPKPLTEQQRAKPAQPPLTLRRRTPQQPHSQANPQPN